MAAGIGYGLGIFAAIHGDEPEGALALREFLYELTTWPVLALGYEIYAYPVCNPSGYEDGKRHSRAGRTTSTANSGAVQTGAGGRRCWNAN